MSAVDPTASGLAEAVTDGTVVDWSLLEASAATPEEREIVRQLWALSNAASRRDGPEPGSTWGALVIQDEIGRGTYGTVYRAFDPSLERVVALKLLHASGAIGASHARAVKEGRLLARVRHPNVVTVHGADQHGGRVGLWTEFVSGRTLRDVVSESGPLGANEAALVGLDLCGALAAVHAAGLVHADVKAQNVMREKGGRLVLMDFGAGELVASDDRAARLAGTPAYLAPEVLNGAPASVRSDIYALGVLLFFLVTGEFPVVADSLEGLKTAHDTGRRRLRDTRPDLPGWFVDVVEKAIAPDPEQRPASAGAFEAELRAAMNLAGVAPAPRPRRGALVAAIIGLGAVGLVAAAWAMSARPTALPPARGEVAIATFSVPAGDAVARSIADKLPAAVVGQLGSFNDIRVLGDPPSDRRVPRVTGSVESDGTTARVSVRLVDGANGAEMFADSFERPAADAAALVGDAARAASVAIRQRTVERQWARLQSSAHRNEAAIALYLRGAAHLSLRREDELQRSLALFRQAATVEPTFALAHASAAEALTLLGVFRQVPIMSALRDARASALKSLELDGNLPEGHAIFGYIEKLRFDFPAAEKSLRRAIELQPDFVDAHVRLSTVLLQQGSYGDALVEIKSALALEPNSVAAQSQFAVTLLLSRRYDEAIAEAKGFLKRHPGRPIGMEIIAEAELYRGNPAGAITHFREAIANEPRGSVDPTLVAGLAMSEARAGNVRVATDMLAELQARFEHGSGGTAAEVAAVQLALGRKKDALDWLTRSVTSGESEAGYLKINPRWDALRGTPAFEELVRSVRPRT